MYRKLGFSCSNLSYKIDESFLSVIHSSEKIVYDHRIASDDEGELEIT